VASDSRRDALIADVPFVEPTLRLNLAQYRTIVAHCYDGLPNEACGLLIGPIKDDFDPTGDVTEVYPCTNADESARTYTVAPDDILKASNRARTIGEELIAVWHSHTHTDAYPSDTDVRKAAEPYWVYVIVSLKHAEPVMRGYRIRDGQIHEVDIDVAGL
jgi:[CysO sulfur-carrier protein]-S-L-cysteine hydrolase